MVRRDRPAKVRRAPRVRQGLARLVRKAALVPQDPPVRGPLVIPVRRAPLGARDLRASQGRQAPVLPVLREAEPPVPPAPPAAARQGLLGPERQAQREQRVPQGHWALPDRLDLPEQQALVALLDQQDRAEGDRQVLRAHQAPAERPAPAVPGPRAPRDFKVPPDRPALARLAQVPRDPLARQAPVAAAQRAPQARVAWLVLQDLRVREGPQAI